MPFIFLSVFFNILTSVILKISNKSQSMNLSVIIWFNYLVMIIFCLLFFNILNIKAFNFNSSLWYFFILLGVLLPFIFILMGIGIHRVGIIKVDSAQRLSLIIPIIISFTFLGEPVSFQKIFGIFSAFLAIFFIIYSRNKESQFDIKNYLNIVLLICVWLGLGLIDTIFKAIAKTGDEFIINLLIVFTVAFFFMTVYIIIRQLKINLRNLLTGLLLGCSNFFNILFYIKAHQYYPQNPSLVFTTVNIGVIITALLLGRLVFKEHISILNCFGIFLAVIAILILYY